MAHRSRVCSRLNCTDKHPYHLHNGMILRSIRQSEGGPLMDTKEASELIDPKFREVRNVVSQNDFDVIFRTGYEAGERTARESAVRLF